MHIKQFYKDDNDVHATEIPELFWQHYKRDKTKANSLLGIAVPIPDDDRDPKVIYHSEQALAEAFEMTDEIFDILKLSLSDYSDKGLELKEIFLDVFSTNQVCINCQKRFLAMQNSHNEGFLKKFRDIFSNHFILPSNEKLKLIIRVSADKTFTKNESISNITPDSLNPKVANKSKVIETPEASLTVKLKEDLDINSLLGNPNSPQNARLKSRN